MIKKNFSLMFFVCAVLVGYSKIAHADFKDDFNTLDCNKWDCSRLPCPPDKPCLEKKWVPRHKAHPRLVSSPRTSANIVPDLLETNGNPDLLETNGNSYLSLTSTPKDRQVIKGTNRAEIADPMRVEDGGTSWYKVRLRIPEDFDPPANTNCVFMQVHDQDQKKDGTPEHLKHKPPVAFRVNSAGKTYVTFNRVDPQTGKDAAAGNNGVREKINLPTFKKGQWVDIAMKIQWGDPGSAQIFINGQLAVSYPDPMCKGPMCTPPMGNRPKLVDEVNPDSDKRETKPTIIQQGNYLKLGPYCGDNKIEKNYSVDVDHFSRASGKNCPSFFDNLCDLITPRVPASASPHLPSPTSSGVK